MASQSAYRRNFTAMKSKKFKSFFQSIFMDSLSNLFTNMRPHKQNSFFSTHFFCFLFQAPGCIETCENGVTNCKTSKRALVPLLPGEMKFDL